MTNDNDLRSMLDLFLFYYYFFSSGFPVSYILMVGIFDVRDLMNRSLLEFLSLYEADITVESFAPFLISV